MMWIDLKDQLPERDQKCIVYCSKETGFHVEGIYMAWYVKPHDREDFYFLIDDKSGIDSNYKSLSNFSHWMPMPDNPKALT